MGCPLLRGQLYFQAGEGADVTPSATEPATGSRRIREPPPPATAQPKRARERVGSTASEPSTEPHRGPEAWATVGATPQSNAALNLPGGLAKWCLRERSERQHFAKPWFSAAVAKPPPRGRAGERHHPERRRVGLPASQEAVYPRRTLDNLRL